LFSYFRFDREEKNREKYFRSPAPTVPLGGKEEFTQDTLSSIERKGKGLEGGGKDVGGAGMSFLSAPRKREKGKKKRERRGK